MHTSTQPPIPPVPVLTGLGQALRWLRERQVRKQYQVASAAGITKGMLSAYETGRQRPSLETLDKLLETLGCDLNDLHNALQIVNGRPEQMKGWRGGSLGPLAETAAAWPDDRVGRFADVPPYGAFNGVEAGRSPTAGMGLAATAGEIHELGGGSEGGQHPGSDPSHLHRLLGLLEPLGISQGPAAPLPPEEAVALAQMLEGFHNLLRYWHRCLTALAEARAGEPAEAPGPPKPPSPPTSARPSGGHLDDPGPASAPQGARQAQPPRVARAGSKAGVRDGKSGGSGKDGDAGKDHEDDEKKKRGGH